MKGMLVVYFKCTVCSELFKREDYFYQHCRSVHCTETVVFECDMNDDDDDGVQVIDSSENIAYDCPNDDVNKANNVLKLKKCDDDAEIQSTASEKILDGCHSFREHLENCSEAETHVMEQAHLQEIHLLESLSDKQLISETKLSVPGPDIDKTATEITEKADINFQEIAALISSQPVSLATSDQVLLEVKKQEDGQVELTNIKQEDRRVEVSNITGRKTLINVKAKSGVCSHCKTYYKSLPGHIRYFHKKKLTYVCELCGKRWAQKSDLDRHKAVHSVVKPFKCDVCGQTFKQKARRDIHQRYHTVKDRPFLCTECGKSFRAKFDLHRHSQGHSKEYYKCEICGVMLKYKTNIRTHMLSHLKPKAHNCDVCGRAFKDKHNLVAHKRIHSEKEHTCEFCGMAFHRLYALKKHRLSKHSTLQDLCEKIKVENE